MTVEVQKRNDTFAAEVVFFECAAGVTVRTLMDFAEDSARRCEDTLLRMAEIGESMALVYTGEESGVKQTWTIQVTLSLG